MKTKQLLTVLTACAMTGSLFFAQPQAANASSDTASVQETAQSPEGAKNLAIGKTVTIQQPYGIFDQLQGIGLYGLETPLSKGDMLTDGKYGSLSNWANTADWFVFYRKMERTIIVDLGQTNSVNSLSIGFGQRSDVGIAPPINIRYYVSNDGTDYRFVGKALPDYPLFFANTTGASDMHRKVYKLDKLADGTPLNVQARYVKLVVPINFFGWTDEIEVVGKEGVADGAVLPKSQTDNYVYDRYSFPGAPESAEIRDQFLWYTGPMSNPYFTDWTKEKAEVILGYKDIYGEIKDWFFDDLLAIPVTGMITPSGFDKAGNARYVTKEDMLAFVDFIMKKDTQLGAINAAAGEVNAKLKTDRKVRINMAIPMIEESSNFGDIYGDGNTLSLRAQDFASRVADPNSLEGRYEMARLAFENKKAAVRWYIDEVERRFKEMGYDNLVLNSYYWYHERISEPTGEAELIQATSAYLNSKGFYFTWIPYIGPGSMFQWRDLGFTTASIQPGFAFGVSKKEMFPAVANLARKTGASLEIEYDDYRTLNQYLNFGERLGYMNDAPNTYYLAAMPIVEGAYAFTPVAGKSVDFFSAIRRSVYDRVFEYAKGDYQRRFTASLVTNLTNKADMGVSLKLPLADSFVEGNLSVHYDAAKTSFAGFDVPTALQGKGTFEVDTASEPGVAKISFKLNSPGDAILADLLARRNPMQGAPELVNLHFAKKEEVSDAEITSRLFVIGREGTMKDADGAVYLNWGESDIVPGSPEDILVKAAAAVKKAESSRLKGDVTAAMEIVELMPGSPLKKEFHERLHAVKMAITGKAE